MDGENGNVDRLWDFLKVTLRIGPQASSLFLHPLQLLGEGEVVEIGFSSDPASLLQGFSAFSLYTLPDVSWIPAVFIWPNVF